MDSIKLAIKNLAIRIFSQVLIVSILILFPSVTGLAEEQTVEELSEYQQELPDQENEDQCIDEENEEQFLDEENEPQSGVPDNETPCNIVEYGDSCVNPENEDQLINDGSETDANSQTLSADDVDTSFSGVSVISDDFMEQHHEENSEIQSVDIEQRTEYSEDAACNNEVPVNENLSDDSNMWQDEQDVECSIEEEPVADKAYSVVLDEDEEYADKTTSVEMDTVSSDQGLIVTELEGDDCTEQSVVYSYGCVDEIIAQDDSVTSDIPAVVLTNDSSIDANDTSDSVSQTETISVSYAFESPASLTMSAKTASVKKFTGWKTENGKQYWYENGVKQGTTGRGKEIYDPGSKAWYWLDAVQGGAKAVSKDVYMESQAGQFADRDDGTGKWVRYDKNGHMIKGWQTVSGKTYYFDPTYGSMAHGKATIDKLPCWFDESSGVGKHLIWEQIDNQDYYWYENGKRQGYDPKKPEYRGKEIYDPVKNSWYWLDNNAKGKKAVSKDVYQPYTYQGIDNTPKWVRYDSSGQMIKGWDCTDNGLYYFDNETGAMKKGHVNIFGEEAVFDDTTGILTSDFTPGLFLSAIEKFVKNDMKESGILASLTAAQAYLESGYGNSKLTKEANNLFGIKGFYNGDSITMTTQEYIGGRWVTQKDIFRKYPSWIESISDHSGLFNSLDRYANLRNLKEYRSACINVRNDGYATDPLYPLKLINIIKRNELNKWDGSGSSSGYSNSDIDVEVTASALNVRSSASMNSNILTTLPKGMIVVIDQVNGKWGRLADYTNGWIYLDYVNYR